MSGLWSLYNQGGSGGPPQPQLRGRMVFVDSRYGDDTTGMIERADLPFATIEGAYQAIASSNISGPFVIHIRPGTYDAQPNIISVGFSNEIHFHAENGVEILIGVNTPFPAYSTWIRAFGNTIFSGNAIFRVRFEEQNCSVFETGVFTLFAHTIECRLNAEEDCFLDNRAGAYVETRFLGVNVPTNSFPAAFIINRSPGLRSFLIVKDLSQGSNLIWNYNHLSSSVFHFYSPEHLGSIACLDPQVSPNIAVILSGTKILANLNIPPLGIRPQSVIIQGQVYADCGSFFIPDLLSGNLGELVLSGQNSSWTNRHNYQSGYLEVGFTSSGMPPFNLPPGSSLLGGWFVIGQMIKSFSLRELSPTGATGLIALGTQNLGPLTPFFNATEISANRQDFPLLVSPSGITINNVGDRLAIFASPLNTQPVFSQLGGYVITANLGKAI